MKIKYCKREQIDDDLWDACVKKAVNGHVFAQSWYLDIACDDWGAVVADDYLAVLPLPLKRNSLFKRVYSPYWSPYLGIINQQPLPEKDGKLMLEHIPNRNFELVMNAHNKLLKSGLSISKVLKFSVLDLIEDLSRIESNFRPEMKSVVDSYKAQKVTVVRALNGTEYIDFVKHDNVYSERSDLPTLLKIVSFALRYKSAGLYAAYDESNSMIAGAFILKSQKCLSLIHCADVYSNHDAVKAIVYHMLEHNAGSNLTLEFPFYSKEIGQGFSDNEHHCLVYKKGLPKWISLIS
ncbi:hypothetical protein [Carboxylicivirga marina]|uniref:hypothetical protein n=1 Tax=Carboxylicivirga marina TaxID=2800988 RepID=UPI002592C5B6|nr:hypothetical protein [uncultured Carboxylicivirga sp.]